MLTQVNGQKKKEHLKGLWWKSMWLIDANVILRYLLGDNEEMQSEAEKVIDEGAFTLPEVLAEVENK